jgi:hypothetical protein
MLAACGPSTRSPGSAATPVATPAPAPALRFAWPSSLVLQVELSESSLETDGTKRQGDHVFLLGYRRDGADQHRFWVAGFAAAPGPVDPLSRAMDEVAAAMSFAIDPSLRIGTAQGEAAWVELLQAAPALAASTPEAQRMRAVVATPEFLQHVRSEAWSEWDFVVGQWWPFFAQPPPGGLDVPEGSDGTWSYTWTRRDQDGVAIVTLVRSGAIDHAPMPQHTIGLIGVEHGMKSLGGRGSLTLELRTDPATMIPRSLVEVHEVVLSDGAGGELRGRLEHRARYQVVTTTPRWRPLP